MSMAETVRVLRAMSLFQGLHDKALRVVALSGEALVLNAGERLWEKDDDGPFVVIVLAYYGYEHFLRAWDIGDSTIDIELPIWPSKLLVPFAFGILTFR
ncbi:MAG: hypothetical protein AAFZ09_14235, partial [Pseudomonadota bacterium]